MKNQILHYIGQNIDQNASTYGQDIVDTIYLRVADELEEALVNMEILQGEVDEDQIFDSAIAELGIDNVYQVINAFLAGMNNINLTQS